MIVYDHFNPVNEHVRQIRRRMQDETDKTLVFFQAIPADSWNLPIYEDGATWTVHVILCHFLDAERGLQRIIMDVLSGGSGAPEGFDIDEHNAAHVAPLVGWEPDALLVAWGEARQTTLDAITTLQDSDLARFGRHPALGVRSLEDLIKAIYLHNKVHQRDIQRVLTTR